MMNHHTSAVMPKTKVALTPDTALLEQVDELVERRRFRSRGQAVEAALADKVQRLARTLLARESAKLNPREVRPSPRCRRGGRPEGMEVGFRRSERSVLLN